jgi:hypothetical protein
LSSDPNRPRPRSSKKRRAVQSGGAPSTGGPRPTRPAGQRIAAGGTRGGSTSGGIPTAWLAVIAVVVFAIGVALAGGVLQFGGGASPSLSPSSAFSGQVSLEPASPPAARGTNCPTAQPPAAPAGQTRVVTIETAKGQIQITLKADLSPIAAGSPGTPRGTIRVSGVSPRKLRPRPGAVILRGS